MRIKMRPTTLATDTKVVKPFVRACSMPANVKSSPVILNSINEVYGARAMIRHALKMGLAYPTRKAKIAPLIKRCHGFSASVMGPPKDLKSCQTTIRISMAYAVTCMTLYAFVTNGKYSSMAVISVPNASRNRPDTASIN